MARIKFTSIDKCVSNDQSHHKLSNHFWQAKRDVRHANNTNTENSICLIHGKPPEKHILANHPPKPKLQTMLKSRNGHMATPPINMHIKCLHIARHNQVIHQIARTLQTNKHTRYYTLINT